MNGQGSAQGGVPRPGEVLGGKYEVQRVLGAGGMGVVLAARDSGAEDCASAKPAGAGAEGCDTD